MKIIFYSFCYTYQLNYLLIDNFLYKFLFMKSCIHVRKKFVLCWWRPCIFCNVNLLISIFFLDLIYCLPAGSFESAQLPPEAKHASPGLCPYLLDNTAVQGLSAPVALWRSQISIVQVCSDSENYCVEILCTYSSNGTAWLILLPGRDHRTRETSRE